MIYGKLDLRNCADMELMKDAPDNHWDLAICDNWRLTPHIMASIVCHPTKEGLL